MTTCWGGGDGRRETSNGKPRTDLVKSLAVQGTGWILFLLAAIACFWLLKKLLSAQADCQKIGETLSEKRLERRRRQCVS